MRLLHSPHPPCPVGCSYAAHVLATHLTEVLTPIPSVAVRRLFSQPMVPVVGAEDGRWLVPRPLAPCMKPGGHGAIWKLMLDQGIFQWFAARGREAALVRQIRCFARLSPCCYFGQSNT